MCQFFTLCSRQCNISDVLVGRQFCYHDRKFPFGQRASVQEKEEGFEWDLQREKVVECLDFGGGGTVRVEGGQKVDG